MSAESCVARVRAKLAAASGASAAAPEPVWAAGPEDRMPDCRRCPDHCCRTPHQVSLRLLDVATLIDAGLGDALAPPPAPSRLLPGSPPSATRFPVLRSKPNGECVFLDEARRCTIYAIRPLACRRFPLFVDGDAVLRWASSCRAVRATEPGEASQMQRAARESWATKATDLQVLDEGPGALVELGLDPALFRSVPSETFAAVLARRRGGRDGA